MKRLLAISTLVLLAGCGRVGPKQTLAEARARFTTHVVAASSDDPVEPPPKGVLDVVRYHGPVGDMAAYLTPDPGDGKRHPAIVWITGGDYATLGDVWSPAPAGNDQSARAFREAGIVTMYPSLRGANGNPGRREGFYGEVDDVLAAADYLARQPYVDPQRIYLGGHSTGGTLALLTAEYSPRFRATFSFGPLADVRGYGADHNIMPPGLTDPAELQMRSPIQWLGSIRSPVFVLEGDTQPSNASQVLAMKVWPGAGKQVHLQLIPGASHFDDLAPATRMLARKINADTGQTCNISIGDDELKGLMAKG